MNFSPQPYKSSFQPVRALAGASVPLATSNAVAASAPPASPKAAWQAPKLAKRPNHLLGQVVKDKPASDGGPSVPYYILVAVILGGISIGLLVHAHRDTAAGGIAFGSAVTASGVGFALLLIELATS